MKKKIYGSDNVFLCKPRGKYRVDLFVDFFRINLKDSN